MAVQSIYTHLDLQGNSLLNVANWPTVSGGVTGQLLVSFATPLTSQAFTLTHASLTPGSYVSAFFKYRADTVDNPGDDCDSIDVSAGRCQLGSCQLLVTHSDASQRLFGSFLIGYLIAA